MSSTFQKVLLMSFRSATSLQNSFILRYWSALLSWHLRR